MTSREPLPKTWLGSTLLLAFYLLVVPISSRAQTLYDGAVGTLPSSQGWTFFPFSELGSVSGGAYILDSSTAPSGEAFNSRLDQTVDTQAGFALSLDLRIDTETHGNVNRAGFSLILVGSDPTLSLEVAFWTDRVWVYDYNGGFVHGAETFVDTTVRRTYRIECWAGRFRLMISGASPLEGPLEDYTAQGIPYTVANTLVFGDDTDSGDATAEVYSIATDATFLVFADGFESGGLEVWTNSP